MGRRRIARVALVLISAGLGLLSAELLVARFLPLHEPLLQLDEQLLFTTRPGARRITVMGPAAGGAWVPVQLNRDGTRGMAPSRAKTAERVVVIGDSLVLAENVPVGETFVERLGAHLAHESGEPVEVVNAGVTGYGPDQVLLKLQREFDLLQPDTLLVVLCASNDFGDLLRNKLFSVDAEGQLVPFPFEIDAIARERFARAERAARRWALGRVWDTLGEVRAARERAAGAHPQPDYVAEYLRASRAHYLEFVVQRDPRVYSLFEDTYDADLAIHPEWESSRAKVRAMGAVLGRLAASCGERGVALRALVVPSAVDLCPDFDIRVDPERWPGYEPRRLSDTLLGLLSDAEVPALDLFDPFVAAGPGRLFVGGTDIHWNAAGQDLAARLCARFLLASSR